jgi:hypothetical protein
MTDPPNQYGLCNLSTNHQISNVERNASHGVCERRFLDTKSQLSCRYDTETVNGQIGNCEIEARFPSNNGKNSGISGGAGSRHVDIRSIAFAVIRHGELAIADSEVLDRREIGVRERQ